MKRLLKLLTLPIVVIGYCAGLLTAPIVIAIAWAEVLANEIDASAKKIKAMSSSKLKARLWKLVTLPFVALIYVAVISEGLSLLFPMMMGQALYRMIPGFAFLGDYEGLASLKLAHFFALGLLYAVWRLWVINLKVILLDPSWFFARTRWNQETYRWCALILAIVILGGDALLFYYAMTHQVGSLWEETEIFSLPALLATAMYVGLLVFISFESVNLDEQCEDSTDRSPESKTTDTNGREVTNPLKINTSNDKIQIG